MTPAERLAEVTQESRVAYIDRITSEYIQKIADQVRLQPEEWRHPNLATAHAHIQQARKELKKWSTNLEN